MPSRPRAMRQAAWPAGGSRVPGLLEGVSSDLLGGGVGGQQCPLSWLRETGEGWALPANPFVSATPPPPGVLWIPPGPANSCKLKGARTPDSQAWLPWSLPPRGHQGQDWKGAAALSSVRALNSTHFLQGPLVAKGCQALVLLGHSW